MTVSWLGSNLRTELILCEIRSYGGDHEDYYLLGRDVVYVLTFQRDLLPPLSHDQITLCQIPKHGTRQDPVYFIVCNFCGPRVSTL